jgi:prophage regulatory protein
MNTKSNIVSQDDRFLRMPEVKKLTGLSRAHIYYLAQQGSFPKPYKLGEKASGWLNSQVIAWMQSKITRVNDEIKEVQG